MMLLQSEKLQTISAGLVSLTIVVPCFNEEESLDQLAERLKTLKTTFADRLDLQVVLVDDGSSDHTAEGLENRFRQHDWARVVRHGRNRGITASIRTGIENSTHELVASMDADCTYDPLQIIGMLDLMVDSVDMVTASPYHPDGSVEGVPRWRIALSRAASLCYGLLLGTSLHTYTSCFRLYRRSAVANLPIVEEGFVGVTEMLWQLQRHGGTIVEAPSRLTSRRVGFSKMRTLPVILGHLKLMSRILFDRMFGPRVGVKSP